MTAGIDLGPWKVPTHEPSLRGYAVTIKLVNLPEETGVDVVLEARRDAGGGRAGAERHFLASEKQPYDAILMRDGNTAFYRVQNRLIDEVVKAIAEHDAANPPSVVES